MTSSHTNHREAVLACAGESLLSTDYRLPGKTLCAVSTAIRVIHSPVIWILADAGWNNPFMGQAGNRAILNPSIKKVTRDRQEPRYRRQGVQPVNTVFVDESLIPRDLKYCTSYSLTFAIWWFRDQGYKKLLLAGVDVTGDYGYRVPGDDETLAHKKRQNVRCAEMIGRMARELDDIELVSITPSKKLNALLPYEGGDYE